MSRLTKHIEQFGCVPRYDKDTKTANEKKMIDKLGVIEDAEDIVKEHCENDIDFTKIFARQIFIIVGEHGAGGEGGHVTVDYDETDCCGCGKKGCLEQYASATGIVRLAKKKLANTDKATVLNAETVTAKDVWDAVKAGDEVAIEVAELFGSYLGKGLAIMATISDPAIFVIGGGVSKAGDILLSYVEKNFKERAFFANKNVEFALASLGNDAGIIGAAKLALDNQ